MKEKIILSIAACFTLATAVHSKMIDPYEQISKISPYVDSTTAGMLILARLFPGDNTRIVQCINTIAPSILAPAYLKALKKSISPAEAEKLHNFYSSDLGRRHLLKMRNEAAPILGWTITAPTEAISAEEQADIEKFEAEPLSSNFYGDNPSMKKHLKRTTEDIHDRCFAS